MMNKIYVAGPYTAAGNPRLTQLNVNKAISIGCELIKKGYAPFIPHLCHYIYLHPCGDFPYEYWTKFDIQWLKVCDSFFLIEHSPGADNELEIALKNDMPIYYDIDEVPDIV